MASYLFKNVTWHNGQQKITGDVRTDKGIILETGINLQPKKKEYVGEFKNHFLYPGLINSHDHLEMNLYPKLGTPPYNNYTEWSKDIYKPNASPIREIERVSIEDRLLWGGIKNLISGVTTVVHHNPWNRFFLKSEFPVKVLKAMSWAHSLGLEKDVQKKFPKDLTIPFVIHAGEGTDVLAFSEIPKLDELGLLQKNTVLVHAIALADEYVSRIRHQQTSIVWCPASNLFMFNKTAPIEKIKGKIKTALGTDSTLTGSSTLLDEMHISSKTNRVSSEEIFSLVTSQPASIFNLHNPAVAPSGVADFFIAPVKNEDYFENLMELNVADISLVVVNGKIGLLEAEIHMGGNFSKTIFTVQGRSKKMVVDISTLKKRIEKKVGVRILELNPLWNLLEV